MTHNTLAIAKESVDTPKKNSTSGFKSGYELWENSPCNLNHSAYDPLCLLSLPARDIVNSVPHHWLTGNRAWLEPDNFVFRQPASTVWSKGEPPNDFPLVIGSTMHGAADTLTDCQAIESKASSDVTALLNSIDMDESPKMQKLKNSLDLLAKIALVSDVQMTCPLWNLSRKADRSFTSGVYFYLVTFEESVPCPNGNRLRLAGGLSDISAIMGRYHATDSASSKFASELQGIFYQFVIDGALPGNLRASDGLYKFGQTVETVNDYPPCTGL